METCKRHHGTQERPDDLCGRRGAESAGRAGTTADLLVEGEVGVDTDGVLDMLALSGGSSMPDGLQLVQRLAVVEGKDVTLHLPVGVRRRELLPRELGVGPPICSAVETMHTRGILLPGMVHLLQFVRIRHIESR